MDRFCRGCLVRYDEPAELLQYTEKNRRLFVYSTGLQVKRNDTLTFQLCKDCYLSMKVACSFKKQCRSSDKKLKSYSALKDTGESMDLSAYLKSNDDSLTFKFPMLYGSSTPAHQKPKEDDGESSSSIRNFMTDIMPETDLLETEARIIKEVIEEDADLLDESLDSHWLQDDVSIDTNFRLDLSFSPFSTPRPENNATYSPSKLPENKPVQNQNVQEHNYALTNNALDMPIIDSGPHNELISDKEANNFIKIEPVNAQKIADDILKDVNADENMIRIDLNDIDNVPDSIDKNLEEALKNSNNNEFSLDALLVSPQVIPGIQTPPTPLINNILFGEKLDMSDSNNSHQYVPGHFIETYENVVGDIEMTEFGMDEKIDEFDIDRINKEIIERGNQLEQAVNIKTEIIEEDRQTDEVVQALPETNGPTNFYCKMCSRQFSSLKRMKRHADLHTRVFTCDYCGRHSNDKTNFKRHVQTHMDKNPRKYECEECKQQFNSLINLRTHKKAHSGQARTKSPKTKKFMCTECTFSCDRRSNFQVHMNRHEKNFSFSCAECGKGYYRHSELVIHMRYHTGEKPFKCTFCDRSYERRDVLTRHVKTHLDKQFQCEYCKTKFVNSNHLRNHLKKSKGCSKIRDKIAEDQDKINEEESSKLIVTETTMNNLKTS